MVGSYSHFDAIYPARAVAKPPVPSRLQLSLTALRLAYTFQNQSHTLDDYLSRNPATGLLIARGDTILFERYQYGRTAADRMTSQSMAKTVVAMLVGIAIDEHAIRSVDDPADAYVPELAGTEPGRTPIRALPTIDHVPPRPGHGTRPLCDRRQGTCRGSDAVGAVHGDAARVRADAGSDGAG